MKFDAMVWLDDCAYGFVVVDVPVSGEECDLLKQCYLEGCDPCDFDGLEDLCTRIDEAAFEVSFRLYVECAPDITCCTFTTTFWVPPAVLDLYPAQAVEGVGGGPHETD